MANPARDSWFQQWSREMAAPSGSKVPLDSHQALTAKVGYRPGPRNSGGRRVPGPAEGQVRKKGGIR